MKNILKKIVNRKVGNSEIVEVEQLNPEEEENIFLPIASDALNITEQYNQIVFFYQAGICQLTAKLEILRQEFQACKDRNPIENIETRVKSPESIKGKMERRGFPLTVSSMVKNIMDIAGIRVVCPFISDVYYIAEFLLNQEDIQEIQIKDYIKDPKENGYRSLHLIVMVTGKMSLIGYRPSQHSENELNECRERSSLYQIRPGITGWAQVNGRDVLAAHPKRKAVFDAYYLHHFSLWLDIKIFFLTLFKVFKHSDIEEGVIVDEKEKEKEARSWMIDE